MAKADATELMCTSCGTRLRDGWYRCPRCRVVITASGVSVSSAAPTVSATRPISASAVSSAARGVSAPPVAAARARTSVVVVLVAAIVSTAIGSVIYELRRYPGPIITRAVPAETTAPPVAIQADIVSTPARRAVDADALVAQVAADAVRWGNAALADGDLDQAQAQFEAALAAGPENADLRNSLGEVLIGKSRVVEAVAEFDRAIALDSARFAFRINRARARALLQRWAGAVEDYRVAAARRPDDYATHYNLGLALMELQRYDAASRAIERAITLAPDQSSLLVVLGTAYVAAEHQDLARSAFERFLERAPEDAEAPRVRAMLLALASTPE